MKAVDTMEWTGKARSAVLPQIQNQQPQPQQQPALPQLWTVSEAAAYLRKSESWVWQAVRTPQEQSGSIPHAKLGKSPRFIPEKLQKWAASGFPAVAEFDFEPELAPTR
jgi:hypothetical protein